MICKVHRGDRQSIEHRGTKVRARITDEEETEEDEFGEIQMDIYQEEDPGGTVEEIAKKQDVIFSRKQVVVRFSTTRPDMY